MNIGTRTESVYLLLEGRVQVKLYSVKGDAVILDSSEPGDILGEIAAIDEGPHSATVHAVSDAVLLVTSASSFRSVIFSTPAAAEWLARKHTQQIRKLTDKFFEVNALRVPSRLHCELNRMRMGAKQTEAGLVIEPSPTHAELAETVGTHREAITREIQILTREGIVKQEGRRLTICDVAALAKLVRLVGRESDEDPA